MTMADNKYYRHGGLRHTKQADGSFLVRASCGCGGELRHFDPSIAGATQLDYVVEEFQHKCDDCGRVACLEETYPRVLKNPFGDVEYELTVISFGDSCEVRDNPDKTLALEEALDEISDPDFDSGGRVHNWRRYVCEDIQERWSKLPLAAKLVAYMIANEQAGNEDWD